jgi:hypothetical protein
MLIENIPASSHQLPDGASFNMLVENEKGGFDILYKSFVVTDHAWLEIAENRSKLTVTKQGKLDCGSLVGTIHMREESQANIQRAEQNSTTTLDGSSSAHIHELEVGAGLHILGSSACYIGGKPELVNPSITLTQSSILIVSSQEFSSDFETRHASDAFRERCFSLCSEENGDKTYVFEKIAVEGSDDIFFIWEARNYEGGSAYAVVKANPAKEKKNEAFIDAFTISSKYENIALKKAMQCSLKERLAAKGIPEQVIERVLQIKADGEKCDPRFSRRPDDKHLELDTSPRKRPR